MDAPSPAPPATSTTQSDSASSSSAPSGATLTVAWPSISAGRLGRLLGRWYDFGPRVSLLGVPFRPGWLVALATLPVALGLYFLKIIPRIPAVIIGVSNPFCLRYRLTTERVIIEHPFDALSPKRAERSVRASVAYDGFDTIEIDHRPGQAWYRSGDLVFLQAGQEVLRLAGVPYPDVFRQTCLKASASCREMSDLRERDLAV